MLTRLKVENFKALRDVDISLRERNVLIGPNKSGKTSILQSLQFLTQLTVFGEINKVFNGTVGFQQLLWKGASGGNIRIQIWGDDRPLNADQTPFTFHYQIEVGLDALRNLTISNELLTTHINHHEIALIDAALGKGVARKINGDIVFQNPESFSKPFLAYEVPGWEANLVRKYISGWQFFSLLPELTRVTPGNSGAQPFLDTNGAQLASWLHTFQANYPENFQRLTAVLKEAFPEIVSLSVPVTQAGNTFVSTFERGLKSPISFFYGSEGEIKFLQLLSIILSPFAIGLVGIEEPEAYLHPRLLELLIETADTVRIEQAGAVAQVFATTHSPYLVDLLKPEDVIVIEKRDGATHCTRAEDKNDLQRMLSEGELSFGRLWYSGALGGV